MNRAVDLFERLRTEGEVAIRELIATRQSEELFLDFKRSANDGGSRSLDPKDLSKLSKAISGFGNSEGGVVLWGVECSPGKSGADVASGVRLLQDAQRFASQITGAISGRTVPPHQNVEVFSIVNGGGTGGYVAVLVPKWEGEPLQAIPDLHFYIRAGSDFVPVSHGVLAGLFGRHPSPRITHQIPMVPAELVAGSARFPVAISLSNAGRGIARDVFLNAFISSPSSGSSIELHDDGGGEMWQRSIAFGIQYGAIAKDGVKIAPGGRLHPMTLDVSLKPPFTKKLQIKGTYGAAGSPTGNFEIFVPPEDLTIAWKMLELATHYGLAAEEDRSDFVYRAIGKPLPERKP